MSKFLEDFVNAGRRRSCGIFEGDLLAGDISRELTRNERKKILRGGPISIKVCEYLKKSRIIRDDVQIHQKSISEWQLLDLLWSNIDNAKKGNDTAEYLYKEIMKEKYPPRKSSYDKARRRRKKLEN